MVFVPYTTLQRLLRALWPPYRHRQDARTCLAIERLMDDPSLPCVVGGRYIPNGYGHE